MADSKVSALTALTGANADVADLLPIVDTSATSSKSITLAELTTYLQTKGMPRVTRLGTQHSISSVTGTEVTDLSQTLEAGTYAVRYHLIVQSATATVGPMLGVNFTGTAAVKSFTMSWADASTVLTAYTDDMSAEGAKGLGVIAGMTTKTYSTTSPNMGTTVGVKTTAADIGTYIMGTIVVTVAGDLELWHSSETATATSVEVGSSLVVIRTA